MSCESCRDSYNEGYQDGEESARADSYDEGFDAGVDSVSDEVQETRSMILNQLDSWISDIEHAMITDSWRPWKDKAQDAQSVQTMCDEFRRFLAIWEE